MKTFQQFQIDAHQLDEGKLSLAKMAFKGLTKTPILKKIGTSITKTPIVKKVGNVIRNLRTKPKPSDYVRMYHGTTEKAAKNILKKGMRGSSKNPVSDGVYDNSAFFRRKGFVTNDPEIARQYTMQHQYDGKKPDIVALKVLKKNLRKGTNPGEYTAPVKDIKPVTRGVKPIETRKGQVVQEARVDKLLKYFGDDAIKMLRNKRSLPKIVNQDGANKLRQFKHLKRRGVSGKFPNFTPKDIPDKYSKLAVKRKSIYPPDVDAAETQIGDMRIDIGDKKIARQIEKARKKAERMYKG